MEISGRKIGEGYPCFIIAEACMNHMGRFDLAKELVRQSKEAGADAVKFQHHIADAEMLPDVQLPGGKKGALHAFLTAHSLSIGQHRELMALAKDLGIIYLCTPFSAQAAEQLHGIGLSAFKIGSGEMTNLLMLEYIAAWGKPMMVSTGMSALDEIDATYEALLAHRIPLALLNCVSEYPPRYEDMNLDCITTMKQRYPEAVIGHSDHSPNAYTSFLAAALGAHIIEKHVIVDKSHKSGDEAVSLDFRDFKGLVDGIRTIEAARGTKRLVHAEEKPTRDWAFHYAVAEQGLRAGTTISTEMIRPGNIWAKRTGAPTGIPSYDVRKLIGKTVLCDIPANTPLRWKQFTPAPQTADA